MTTTSSYYYYYQRALADHQMPRGLFSEGLFSEMADLSPRVFFSEGHRRPPDAEDSSQIKVTTIVRMSCV